MVLYTKDGEKWRWNVSNDYHYSLALHGKPWRQRAAVYADGLTVRVYIEGQFRYRFALSSYDEREAAVRAGKALAEALVLGVRVEEVGSE